MSKSSIGHRASESLDRGFFGRVFTSYGAIESNWRGSAIYGAFSRIRGLRGAVRLRRGVARSVEGSMIIRAIRRFASALPWVTLRTFGVFLFSFGFYTSVIFAIKAIASTLTADVDALVSGVLMMLLSMPLLLSTRTLAGALTSSRFASYLVFDILGYRREEAETERRPRRRSDTAFLSGMIIGLLTFYIEPQRILSALLSLILFYVVLSKPETGVMLLFGLFPFFSDAWLSAFVVLILVSYILKLICGRRTLHFDAADTFMLIFLILTAAAELINYGAGTEHSGSVRSFIYMAPYFLTVNLITNQTWRSRLMRAVMFGGSAMAVISICALLGDTVTELTAGVGSGSIVSSVAWMRDVTESAGVSSYYLAMMLPIMMAYILRRGTGGKRVNMLFFSAVMIAAAVLTMSRGLWLAAAYGVVVMLLILDLRLVLIPAGAAAAVPIIVALLPDSVREGVMSLIDVSGPLTQDRVAVRRLSGEIFFDNFFGGIGRGDGVFYSVYDAYSSVGASADNSQSLFLQIGVELGVFGLFVFLLAMMFLLIKSFSGAKHGPDRTRRLCSGALAAGLLAALVAGISNHIWVDDRMFLLFFMFAGAVSAYNGADTVMSGEETVIGVVRGDGNTASVEIGY